ncbi:MAG: PQQ-dependent sugar dehydrogenase [Anaerolineales bacterium]|nr:PQQ-dependent sugar dehydrogenase [Anaerolineales bacterium]MCB0011561.1 PQQ-dependent sugar dehydrogenase [Anaerolineales bacterium]MCB0018434.1 PQQ-dependent sugar dehydrogenase [Anaerolineales bacterium]MCB8961457.1 PQQ-dependent sugar dehydrogenase [Ardenticatenales bacterium]
MNADRPRTGRFFWLPVLVLALVFLTANQLYATQLRDETPESAPEAPSISLDFVVNGLFAPVAVTHAGDERLFVVEQPGVIQIVQNGVLLGTPFLDINDRVAFGGEMGLLGLVFAPDYATSGAFYVNYTFFDGSSLHTRIARYHVTANPNVASRTEETVLIIQQDATNHNGGDMHFGPDGYLYIGMGDGGNQNDPLGHAQDGASLKGKILRIDVTGQATYAIPPDNPYVNNPDVLDEIWAFGLRNPWRWSFDRGTGAMWIGDVGQGSWEEVNYVPYGSSGRNYGWNCFEGTHVFPLAGPLCSPGINHTPPIHEYSHSVGHAITGGYVYRGTEYPRMGGYYFFADFSFSKLWTLNWNGTGWHLTEYSPSIVNPSSFGEGVNGELYLLSHNGSLFEITETNGNAGLTPRVYLPLVTTP